MTNTTRHPLLRPLPVADADMRRIVLPAGTYVLIPTGQPEQALFVHVITMNSNNVVCHRDALYRAIS